MTGEEYVGTERTNAKAKHTQPAETQTVDCTHVAQESHIDDSDLCSLQVVLLARADLRSPETPNS